MLGSDKVAWVTIPLEKAFFKPCNKLQIESRSERSNYCFAETTG